MKKLIIAAAAFVAIAMAGIGSAQAGMGSIAAVKETAKAETVIKTGRRGRGFRKFRGRGFGKFRRHRFRHWRFRRHHWKHKHFAYHGRGCHYYWRKWKYTGSYFWKRKYYACKFY